MSELPKAPPRLEAADRWLRISQGNIDTETMEWLKSAAAAIHEAAFLNQANDRRLALQKATGIVGRASIDKYVTDIAVKATPDATPLQQRQAVAGLLNRRPSNFEEDDALRRRVSRARRK